jgi:hypothetical protein
MAELERLTASARDAAEQGRWDLVDECYRMREVAMQGVSIAQQDAERMLATDRQVRERVLVAKTALAEQLRQSFATRMRLKGLRSGIGDLGGESGALRMKA